MQIRNAPHYGHEAVFKFLIKKFDFVILNPIFGIKKKNDFSNKYISQALKFIEKKYNKNKILFCDEQFLLCRTKRGFTSYEFKRDAWF